MKRTALIASGLLAAALVSFWLFKNSAQDTATTALPLAPQQPEATPAPSASTAQTASVIRRTPRKGAALALNQAATARPDVLGGKTGRPWDDIADWQTLPPRERLIRLLGKPFALLDRRQVRPLELAKDELYVRDPQTPSRKMHAIPLQADAAGVLREAEAIGAKNGKMPQLVFYPPGTKTRTEQNRRVLSDEVLMQPADIAHAVATATQAGMQQAAPLTAAPGFVLARDNRFPGAAIVSAADLIALGVPSAQPQLAMQMQRRAAPNDLYYPKQWHLKQSGLNHVNVEALWASNKGTGVVVGIIDDGLQIAHPDLSPNVDTTLPTRHLDINDGDTDPSPNAILDNISTPFVNEAEDGDNHGTAVAGLAAARSNNGIGVSGVAPEATLVGIRLTAGPSTASEEATAFGHFSNVVQIKNNSWGPYDVPWILGIIDPVAKAAFVNGVANGRSGLGTIYTWAGGNGRDNQDQSNKDAYANSIEVFAIGALTRSGVPAYYSEYGTNLVASAPADGVYTTDLMGLAGYNPTQNNVALSQKDYTNDFNGTSAATPVVSGVIALILKANPNLGWRDVKEILLRSSRKVAPTDAEWISRSGGRNGIAPIKHNPKYGGGMVDAAAAVAMATGWTNLAALDAPLVVTVTGDTSIPDGNVTGITKSFDFSAEIPTRVEHVEVKLNAHHEYRGNLEIQLISPSGTISTLAYYSTLDGGEEYDDNDIELDPNNRGYFNWVFSSVRHWGEGSVGIWRLVIRDKSRLDVGTYHTATVTLHGVSTTPVSITSQPVATWALTGASSPLAVAASGAGEINYQWRKATSATTNTNLAGQTSTTLNFTALALPHAAKYNVVASNVTGSETSNTVSLAVYALSPANATFNENSTLSLTASAAAPTGIPLNYQWFKGSVALVNDSVAPLRIAGAQSKTLTIKTFGAADADTYRCEVTMSGLMQSMGNTAVIVRYAPVINTTAFPPDLIVSSSSVNIPFSITNEVKSVSITGLPAGLVYNKVTGTITGIPTAPVTNKPIIIKVTNAAGTASTTLLLTVAALPPRAYGIFNGLIARDLDMNNNHGGSINMTVQNTGSLSGSVTVAGAKKPFTGRLIATTMGNPTASIQVSRLTKPATYYTLDFTIDTSTGQFITSTLDADAPVVPVAITAWRNPYSATNKALAGTIIGRHNVLFTPPASLTTKPEGHSHGSVVITDLGVATIAIKPADNTVAYTRASTIGEDGSIPLHQMLYTDTGSMHGTLALTDTAPNTIAGTVTWRKTVALTASAAAAAKVHPGTFDFGVGNGDTLTVTGCEYKASLAGTILWGIRIPAVLGPVDANAQLTFTLGDIATSNILTDLDKAFRITTAHAITFPLPNLVAVTFKVTPSTGAFTGTAVLRETSFVQTRSLSFSGVVIPNQLLGTGYFVVPMKLSAATTPIPMTTGKVSLTEKP